MKSIADIKAIRDKMQSQIFVRDNTDENSEIRIVVGMATCGISAGKLEPIVEVFVPGQEKVTYVHMDAEKAKNVVANHIVNGNAVKEYMITNE